MLIQKIRVLLFVALASAMALSCGGRIGVNASSAPGIVSQFSTVLGLIPKGNAAATLPAGISGNVSTGLTRSRVALGCESFTPAMTTDVDSDGIALTKIYTFACSNYNSGSYAYDHTGTFSVTDLNDNVDGMLGGYLYEFDITKWSGKDLTTGLSSGGTYKGHWRVTGDATSMTMDSVYGGDYSADYNLTDLGLIHVAYEYQATWNVFMTYSGVSGGLFDSGNYTAKGTFVYSGTFLNEGHSGNHQVRTGDAAFTWETVDLTYDRTCTKFFKSGKIRLSDEGGSLVELVYSCSAVKVYLNGALQEEINL